jgi:diguanylate cyclase (GGDEF)-like protein/PAS domain S-box-containing protein
VLPRLIEYRKRSRVVRSLGIRLALVISAVLSVLMLIAGFWLDRQLTEAMRAEEVRQAELHGSTLLASLRTLMLNGQGTLARSWLDRMHGEAGIIDIEVYRRNGNEAFADTTTVQAVNGFLGYPRFERQPTVPEHPGKIESSAFGKSLRGKVAIDWSEPGQMTLFMPIERNDECLACHGYEDNPLRGVLKLSLSTTDGEARIDSMRYRLWAIAAGLVTLLGTVMWLALRQSVLKPIARLRDAITRVGQGDRHTKLAVKQHDELGEVATVFNLMQEQLIAGETRIRAVMDNVVDAVITIDEKGIIESANQAVLHVFGYSPRELLGQNIMMLMPAPYSEEHDSYLASYVSTGKSRILGVGREVVGQRKDGTVFPLDLAVSEMWLHGQRFFIGIARDITERKEQIAAIEYQALHDALTDLPNRTLLSDRLHQAILAATRGEQTLALIIMDLDHFKEINDTLGHHNGDLILQQVANRVRRVLRESDTVARLGGDEFAVLLSMADLADATQIAKKLLDALDQPFELEAQSFRIGASLGIALFPEHGRDGAALMKRADVAMYEAKRNKMGFAVYDPSKDQHSLRNLSLMGELRTALDKQQLVLYYQPKVNMQTGRVSGVEALVRWHHPQHGLMYPNEFISLAEQAGLIKQVTLWVLKEAMTQSRDWEQSGIDVSMAVNLSVHNLHDATFPQEVASILRVFSSDQVNRLRFEITETAMMVDPSRALEILNALGTMGIRLSIDDFGTGYSSLSYLKQLPVAELKIDKSFIMSMEENDNDAVIVRSTIELAHNIGLRVVAEGVEDKKTYEMLAALSCDSVQGFYISRPMPPEEFSRWLQQPPWGLHLTYGKGA